MRTTDLSFAALDLRVFATVLFLLPLVASADVSALLETHCFACHDADSEKGGIRLDHLDTLTLEARLDLLNKAQEQIYFRHMPPPEKKPPTDSERQQLLGWLRPVLREHGASTLEEKLQRPEYANYVDHDQLFSGEHARLPGFTHDRRWLISEFIFDAKFNRLLNHTPFQTIDGKREFVIGDNNRRVNLTNPFLLPTNSGVRYYANTTLNGGHLLTMITNAKEAADYMVYLTKRDQRYLPAVGAVMNREWEHEKTLASRESFLNSFVEEVLIEIYGEDEHEALLPEFTPVVLKARETEGEATKKAPWHAANPGREEMDVVFRSMIRHRGEGVSDEERIARSERDWFNFGHDERRIQARVTFLNGYLEEYLGHEEAFAKKNKPREFKPLPEEEMAAVTATIRAHREPGDRYVEIIDKCLAEWAREFEQERIEAGLPDDAAIGEVVNELFVKILERPPTSAEAAKHATLARSYFENLGNLAAIEKLIQTLILNSEFVYRSEFGQGEPDEHDRRMLSPRDAAYAISYALTDSSPDEQLLEAAQSGKLATREDYEREVRRLLVKRDQFYVIDEAVQRLQLTASITNLPIRKLRFFREFFGYPQMLPIFKDNKRFGGNYDNAKGRLVGEADRLVEHILNEDRDVFEQLLTTEEFYVFHSGDNEAMTASSERIRRIYEYFKDLDWRNFEEADLIEHKEFLDEVKMRGVDVSKLSSSGRRNSIREFKTAMESFTLRFDDGETAAAPYVSFPAHGPYNASTRTGLQLRSPEVAKFFNIRLDHWNYPSVQPAKVENRRGMLTHPAWLIAHAQNQNTDPVIRGKWVREKLLAGTVPDLPITVDAVVPEDHHKTLRSRLAGVTEAEYCWKCHERMNPLGYAFEMYDDFGRFRTEESLEHPDNLIEKGPDKAPPHVDLRHVYKTLPVESAGYLEGTGDDGLDGEVAGAIDLAERLAKSDRVRQSIIRHAFRYFLGRNETLSDSKTLIDADRAYLDSGGSFDAVIVSLLTSDSFIYRKPIQELSHENQKTLSQALRD